MFDVELYFCKSRPFLPHFLQLVTGFNILQQQKIIALHKHYDSTITFPFSSTFSAKINNKTNILFDICDGTDNFVLSDHIDYFKKNNITIFKRAYDPSLYRDFSFVRPLGLNYYGLYGLFQKTYLHFLYTQPFFYKNLLNHLNCYCFSDLNKYWSMRYKTSSMENDLILFCTRLWEINKTKDTTIPEINEKRISIIQQIRRHFPKKAIAGVSDSPIARKMCPDLILSHSITNRKSFIKIMNCATICIASTGLHKSTGWRFAEYIAAGKAIISEPLFFSIPGDFAEKKNYIAFNTSDQLVSAIDYLLSQPQVVYKMKMNNLLYFHHYIRPDSLVLNALSSII